MQTHLMQKMRSLEMQKDSKNKCPIQVMYHLYITQIQEKIPGQQTAQEDISKFLMKQNLPMFNLESKKEKHSENEYSQYSLMSRTNSIPGKKEETKKDSYFSINGKEKIKKFIDKTRSSLNRHIYLEQKGKNSDKKARK